MDNDKDKSPQGREDFFTDSLREALRRREAKRPQVEVPADFLDSVMQQVESENPSAKAKTWRTALTPLAIAACTITAVLLVWPKRDGQEPTAGSPIVRKEQIPSPSSASLHPVTTEIFITPKPVAKNHTEKKRPVSQQTTAQTQRKDESDNYMAELESGLADVRDSCYLAQVERMIADNEELQRLINEMTNQKQ